MSPLRVSKTRRSPLGERDQSKPGCPSPGGGRGTERAVVALLRAQGAPAAPPEAVGALAESTITVLREPLEQKRTL